MSYRNIVKQVKQAGHNVSGVTVHRIQHGKSSVLFEITYTKQVQVVLSANVTHQLLLTS
jgi:hypothetical protein